MSVVVGNYHTYSEETPIRDAPAEPGRPPDYAQAGAGERRAQHQNPRPYRLGRWPRDVLLVRRREGSGQNRVHAVLGMNTILPATLRGHPVVGTRTRIGDVLQSRNDDGARARNALTPS